MIKFFRKVRQKLLSENKFSKYLLYAFGEIVLVVIGILIALQVNNWNEKGNLKQKEKLLLLELANNLKADINDLNYNLERDSLANYSLQLVLRIVTDKLPYHDSLALHFGRMSNFTNFINNTSSYESMKSSGFNAIALDSLRFQIINYYETEYKLLIKVEDQFINNNQNVFVKPYMMSHFQYNGMFETAHPLDYEALIVNPQLKSLASTMSNYILWKMDLSRECLEEASHLKFEIEHYLNHNM